METNVDKAFREHVGEGFVTVTPDTAQVLEAVHGDAMSIKLNEKEITRTLNVVEGIPTDQLPETGTILLDASDRRKLGVNVGDSVTTKKAD